MTDATSVRTHPYKVSERLDIRVEINPRYTDLHNSEQGQIDACKEMIPDIQRHVDNIGYIGVTWNDGNTACSECGRLWDEFEPGGTPLCCDKAQVAWALAASDSDIAEWFAEDEK